MSKDKIQMLTCDPFISHSIAVMKTSGNGSPTSSSGALTSPSKPRMGMHAPVRFCIRLILIITVATDSVSCADCTISLFEKCRQIRLLPSLLLLLPPLVNIQLIYLSQDGRTQRTITLPFLESCLLVWLKLSA